MWGGNSSLSENAYTLRSEYEYYICTMIYCITRCVQIFMHPEFICDRWSSCSHIFRHASKRQFSFYARIIGGETDLRGRTEREMKRKCASRREREKSFHSSHLTLPCCKHLFFVVSFFLNVFFFNAYIIQAADCYPVPCAGKGNSF